MKLIDGHVHLLPSDNKYGPEFTFYFPELKKRLLLKPLDKIVVIPGFYQDSDVKQVNNQFLSQITNLEYQNKLWPLVWLHPNQADNKLVSNQIVRGIKFHPSISQTTIEDASNLLEIAAKARKPILIHCGRGQLSRIKYVFKVNEAYTTINFVCAHMGGLANELVLSALKQLKEKSVKENLYLDTSGCLNPMLLKRGVDVVGSDHILFGSDTPFFDIDVSLFALKICKFDEGVQNDILYKTARMVYGGKSK